MNLIDVAPLFSTLLGSILGCFVLFSKSGLGKNRKARLALSFLIFILTYISLDYYLYLNFNKNDFFWGSSLLNHLIGFLFYFFIASYIRIEINSKKWIKYILLYSFFRYLLFLPYFQFNDIEEVMKELTKEDSPFLYFVLPEYFITNTVNVVMVVKAFFAFKNTPRYTLLTPRQGYHFKWIKVLFVCLILLLSGTLLNGTITIAADFEDYHNHLRYETILYTFFFFALLFSIVKFPVFVLTGNYEDLNDSKATEKYKRSSLSNSSQLFDRINETVINDQLFLDHNLKLNTLADQLGESIHHISQAINENAHMNFPDYINQFRIELAKQKLVASSHDTIFAIAIDVGFNSKANFYYAFKKATNQTPTSFRKQHTNT